MQWPNRLFTSFKSNFVGCSNFFLGICTAVLALFTLQQACATSESVKQQEQSIALQSILARQVHEALAKFSQGLQIAEANRETFEGMARTGRNELKLKEEESLHQPQVKKVGGPCVIKGSTPPILSEASKCHYVEVVVENPGPAARSHVEVHFTKLRQTCRSETNLIPLKSTVSVTVDVWPCTSIPGNPQELEFTVSAVLDEGRLRER